MVIYDRRKKAQMLQDVADHRLVFIGSRFELLEMQSEEYNNTGKCRFAVGGVGVYTESASLVVPQNWPYLQMINKE